MVVAPLPIGRLADRVGAHRLVTAGGALAALACLTLVASQQLEALLAARCLIGLANAMLLDRRARARR